MPENTGPSDDRYLNLSNSEQHQMLEDRTRKFIKKAAERNLAILALYICANQFAMGLTMSVLLDNAPSIVAGTTTLNLHVFTGVVVTIPLLTTIFVAAGIYSTTRD